MRRHVGLEMRMEDSGKSIAAQPFYTNSIGLLMPQFIDPALYKSKMRMYCMAKIKKKTNVSTIYCINGDHQLRQQWNQLRRWQPSQNICMYINYVLIQTLLLSCDSSIWMFVYGLTLVVAGSAYGFQKHIRTHISAQNSYSDKPAFSGWLKRLVCFEGNDYYN